MDNEVDNLISSGAGDDAIFIGNGGFDHIDGGDGIDTLYLNRNRDDIELSRLDDERYIIASDSFGAEIVGVEQIHFYNGEILNL